MTDDERQAQRKQKIFRACMLGLMTGSGTFLALRYLLQVAVDPAVIAATGVGIAVGMFFLQQVDRS